MRVTPKCFMDVIQEHGAEKRQSKTDAFVGTGHLSSLLDTFRHFCNGGFTICGYSRFLNQAAMAVRRRGLNISRRPFCRTGKLLLVANAVVYFYWMRHWFHIVVLVVSGAAVGCTMQDSGRSVDEIRADLLVHLWGEPSIL